ncbi:MAG TPA: hypothetical protein PKI14_20150, partial [Fervidobacterium sp.]|nr:hypothetical protein [Fervidobacterium sp.]
ENHADGRVYTWRDQRAGSRKHLRDLSWSDISEARTRDRATRDSTLLSTLIDIGDHIHKAKGR